MLVLGEQGVDLSHIGVSMTPGAMALTLMRDLISSSAQLCVIEITAALVAQ